MKRKDWEKMAKIAEEMKRLAKESNVTIIMPAQPLPTRRTTLPEDTPDMIIIDHMSLIRQD